MLQKCKECGIEKDLTEYYKHPQGFNGLLGRCKECIKKGRKSEREKIMARIIDNERYKNNKKRREYCYRHTKEWKDKNPHKRKAQSLVSSYMRRKNHIERGVCCICGNGERVHFHHENYDYPNRIYRLCNKCHINRHHGNIELNINDEIILPF